MIGQAIDAYRRAKAAKPGVKREKAGGACFKCSGPATRAIHADGTGTPSGYVCSLCDQAAVLAHRQAALEHVERAQREMGIASEKLSSITFGDPAHVRLRKLYDKIHAEWYHLRDRDKSRWSMDDIYWTARFKEAQR